MRILAQLTATKIVRPLETRQGDDLSRGVIVFCFIEDGARHRGVRVRIVQSAKRQPERVCDEARQRRLHELSDPGT